MQKLKAAITQKCPSMTEQSPHSQTNSCIHQHTFSDLSTPSTHPPHTRLIAAFRLYPFLSTNSLPKHSLMPLSLLSTPLAENRHQPSTPLSTLLTLTPHRTLEKQALLLLTSDSIGAYQNVALPFCLIIHYFPPLKRFRWAGAQPSN